MKIELQDYKQSLKTHDVDFSRVTMLNDCGDGGTEITYYRRKSNSPITVKVRYSISDLAKMLEGKINLFNLVAEENKRILYQLEYSLSIDNDIKNKHTIIYDTLSDLKKDLEKGLFYHMHPHIGLDNAVKVLNLDNLKDVGDNSTIKIDFVTIKNQKKIVEFKLTLINNHRL